MFDFWQSETIVQGKQRRSSRFMRQNTPGVLEYLTAVSVGFYAGHFENGEGPGYEVDPCIGLPV